MSFEEAAAKAKSFSKRPSDADLLKLYGTQKPSTFFSAFMLTTLRIVQASYRW